MVRGQSTWQDSMRLPGKPANPLPAPSRRKRAMVSTSGNSGIFTHQNRN
jgi:hypothetical protein